MDRYRSHREALPRDIGLAVGREGRHVGAPAQPGRLSWHLPTQSAVQGREPKLKKLTGVTSAASALVGGANAGSKLEKLGVPNRADSDLVSINENPASSRLPRGCGC